jgi:hypothetical protein
MSCEGHRTQSSKTSSRPSGEPEHEAGADGLTGALVGLSMEKMKDLIP